MPGPVAAPAALTAHWLPALAASGLQALTLADRRLLPIVQGGMGVGVRGLALPQVLGQVLPEVRPGAVLA